MVIRDRDFPTYMTKNMYQKRIATLEYECLALYAKVDFQNGCLALYGKGFDKITHEMKERFEEMCLGFPTLAEMQGRLTLEDICNTAWDGVPRWALEDFGRVSQV